MCIHAMADKKAYQDWRNKAEKAKQIASDRSLPLWQKAYMIPGAYNELSIGDLQSKHRRKILNMLGQVNVILSRYEIETYDDYQKVDEASLREIVRLAKSLVPNV